MPSRERKGEYFARMKDLLQAYETVLVVSIDHVSAGQLSKIRMDLRKFESIVLMGKNTLMRKVIDSFLEDHPGHQVEGLKNELVGNVGLIFVKRDMAEVRKIVKANVKAAPAKIGQFAECDVVVPPGPTGCDPGQTSWFQALNVPTKIVKGQIEIVSELKLIKKGDRVGASEAGLLQKLNINPFTYGVTFLKVYMNGAVFPVAVLDITDDAIRAKFVAGARMLASLSLALGIPTQASMPHSLGRAVRTLLALSSQTKVTFKYSAQYDKLFSMSPEELAKLASASAAPASGGAAKPAAAAAAPAKAEAAKTEEVDMGGGADLFGGGGKSKY